MIFISCLLLQVSVSSVTDVVSPIILTLNGTVFDNNHAETGFGGAVALAALINVVQLIQTANIINW